MYSVPCFSETFGKLPRQTASGRPTLFDLFVVMLVVPRGSAIEMVGQIPQSTAQPAARTQISQSKHAHMYSTVASSNMPKRNCIPSQLSYVLYNTIRDIGSEEFVWCGYMLV